MIGFVNALAILIFSAQVPHFFNINGMTYVFVAVTLVVVYVLPRFVKSIPAPLVAIVVLTAIALISKADLRTVGDLGTIRQTLPSFFLPDIPFSLETLGIILPYSLALAIVGLLESLMTASIVDDMTDTDSNKNQEARGQGIANIINGFFGGMAGCAMIGQSVINVKSGGRGRLSTFVAGSFLMFLIIVLGDFVVKIPMAVLAGIMIMVSIGTFDWSSFRYIRKAPKADAAVMLITVAIVVATHDLSKGVIAGVLLSAMFFVAKISKLKVTEKVEGVNRHFKVEGQLFFASVDTFVGAFQLSEGIQHVKIDFTSAQIWDESAVAALEKVLTKCKDQGCEVETIGLSSSSKKIQDSLLQLIDQKTTLTA